MYILYGLNLRKEERGKEASHLVAAGSVIGLAYLTRLSALALLATGVAA